MEKLINWSELSRVTTGGERSSIRPTRICKKHIKALDKLFLEEIPQWWREEREKLKIKNEE